MKNKKIPMGMVGIVLGLIISRILSNDFGVNGRLIVGVAALIIVLICIVALIIKKNYLATVIVFILFIPLSISIVGIYVDNMYLVAGGIVVLFLFMILIMKIIPRFLNGKK